MNLSTNILPTIAMMATMTVLVVQNFSHSFPELEDLLQQLTYDSKKHDC